MVVRRTCNAKVCGSIPHGGKFCRDSIAVSIPACHAGDPGSIPGRGDINKPLHTCFQIIMQTFLINYILDYIDIIQDMDGLFHHVTVNPILINIVLLYPNG